MTGLTNKKYLPTLLLICLPSLYSTAQTGPAAIVPEPIKDMGSVYRDQKIVTDFIIKNQGTSTLQITDVKPACGCTVAEYDKMISPGQSGKVHVTVDVSTFSGPIAKGVTVSTNDGFHSQIELTIKANVLQYIIVKPGYARFAMVKGESDPAGTDQSIASSDGTPFDILRVESPIPGLEVSFREATEAERQPGLSGKQWIVKAVLNDNIKTGPLADYITVTTNHPKQKELKIPVSGFVRPILSAIPASANFGEIMVTEPYRKSITIHSFSANPIMITSVESTVKGIEAAVETINTGREYNLKITVNPSTAKGAFSGKLIVHTDNKKMPVLEIEMKGIVN